MREGDTKTLTCTIDGGVPTPLLSWYRQTATGSLIPLKYGGSPITQSYTGERAHNGGKLICRATQTRRGLSDVTKDTTLNLDIHCTLFPNMSNYRHPYTMY